MTSAIASSRGPLICLTDSLTSRLTWTGGATLSVVNQHLAVTNHAASPLALNGAFPAGQWAFISICQITSAFAGTEVINVDVFDSDAYKVDRFINKSVTTTNMFKHQDMQGDMYIPPGGAIQINTDGDLTLNDDLTTAIWGHLYNTSG